MPEIHANGLRFSYFEAGSGPLVLLLHGFPDTPQTWDATCTALADAGFHAVAPFMRGYAPTQIPSEPKYDADTLGRDAIALIEAFGADKAFLVGHDWGASAAYSAAGLRPERLRMLVTLAIPHPASLKPTPQLMWKVRHFIEFRRKGVCERMRANDMRYIDELVQRWSPEWQVPAGETDAVKRALREPGSLEAAVAYYHTIGLKPPHGHRRKISMPAAAFAGTSDMVPPSAYERARSRYLNRYEVVVMPGGHFMHREHPQHFTRELVRVLDAERQRTS